jgi:hypothetical protein
MRNKPNFRIAIFIAVMFIFIKKVNAQSTTLGHFVPGFPAINWAGWDAVTPIPFNLEHRGTQDINFLTGGTQRMTVKGTGFANPGFVGIGVTAPTEILHIHDGNNSSLHVTNGGTGNSALAGVKFGLLNNTVHMIIGQQSTNSLSRIYITTNGAPSAANAKMTITNNGSVGIGNGFNNPNNLLDVNGGDIDINTAQKSYMIADSSVLWHKGSTSNIFVGTGAGQNHSFNLHTYNTLVGKNAGFNCTGAPNINEKNVMVGAAAGFNQTTASRVVLIGAEAGYNNNTDEVTFVGYRAGFNYSSNASNDTYIGSLSGFSTIAPAGDYTFVGGLSGFGNTLGNNNTFIGTGSGQNATIGSFNSCLGNQAGLGNKNHNRNNYFGSQCGASSTGDDNVFMGYVSGNQGVGNKNVVIGNGAMTTDTISNENVTIGYGAAPGGNARNFNVIIGSQSAVVLDSTNSNALVGYKTAFNQTRGTSNAYLGESTGNNVLKGANNTLIGAKSDVTIVNSTNVTNATAIGANAKVTKANHMILGDNNVNVGIGLSADASGPQKKLEIKDAIVAGPSNPNPSISYPTFGASGLRFTNLTAITPTVPNPGLGVLTVDSLGNVIYVKDTLSGGSAFGGICGTSPPGLANDWEIPLKNFNYVFTGQGMPLTTNNVGIGTNCTPAAKLEVLQGSGSTIGSTGLLVTNKDASNYFANVIGIQSMVNNLSPGCVRIAGWFEADDAPGCGGSTIHQAIYVPRNGGAVTIGYSTPAISISQLLQVNGSALFNTTVYPSDISLKNTITTLPNSLNQIRRLRPVTFKWNTVNDSAMAGTHTGFIAQEIDTVIPQVVRTSGGGIKTVAYTEIIPYLVSAIQSQQKTIDSLRAKTFKQDSINSAVQAQIAALTSSVTSCCSSSAIRQTTPSEQNQLTVNLSDKDVIVLNQNVPNPFAEQTTITYNVPEKYGYAQMIFSTIDGRILKTVDITKKGKGTLTVYSNDLGSGMYTYSLIVDGKTFDTRKMMKSE